MSQWPHMSEIIPHDTGETLIVFLYEEFLLFAEWQSYYPTLESQMLRNIYIEVSALETQKSIYSQTNPRPPPSCCIQADIWPVISPSVEETCGHLMTPTGVMHAIAHDGAMTVSFNISLYILCEMRGTVRSTTLLTGHCRLPVKQHTCSVAGLCT